METAPLHHQRPPMSTAAAKAAAAAAGVLGTDIDDNNTFGDLLAELLRTLPSDASALFLRSLSGLSPSESHDFCDHVAKLKPEKQFRVIHAVSEATVDGKRRFLQTLAKKIEEQQAKQQIQQKQDDKDMEAFMKRKEASSAKERVKAMNPAASKFHSFNAALGAGVAVSKENVPASTNNGNGNGNGSPTSGGSSSSPTGDDSSNPNESVGRSYSSSSLMAVSKEDIKQVGRLLSNSHITESEQNLRELEINNKAFAPHKQGINTQDGNTEMGDVAKRDRPESSRELIQKDEKPLQRTRSEDPEGYAGGYTYASKGQQHQNENENDDENDSPGENDGDDDGENENENENEEDPDAPSTKRWTKLQDNSLRESVRIHGEKNWKAIAELVPGRNHAQCLQRWRKVLKPGLVKGHWSFEEDQILEYLVTQGCNNWGQIAERIPGRTPKQCRERWKNHLDPAINKGPYTEEEDQVILEAQARLGNKWSQIAQLLKGRTEDSVKIRWKSLKQNPAKAAASHAQQKKAQQQQQQQQQHHQHQHQHQSQNPHLQAALAYQHHNQQANPAMLRQRQLQLLQQQQHLQQSEAAQLDHQQQLQQQQLQMRLQERLLQQQQQQRGNNNVDPLAVAMMKPDPSITAPSPISGLGLSMAGSHLYSPAGGATAPQTQSFTQQLTGIALDGSTGYDFNIQTNAAVYGYGLPQLHQHQHHQHHHQQQQDDDNNHGHNHHSQQQQHHHQGHHHREHSEGNDVWDLQHDLHGAEGFTRLGENPPPASFWENYPKHGGGGGLLPEPIPLSSSSSAAQNGHFHPANNQNGHFNGADEEGVYDDAIFERLATELGSNGLHFAAI